MLAATVGAGAAGAATVGPTFVDPTAQLEDRQNIKLGSLDYIAPFAYLKASGSEKFISIGDETNIQDSATIDASGGSIQLGKEVIIAHGGAVKTSTGPATVGKTGTCPTDVAGVAPAACPSFVSFNAEVDGANIQKDAMVSGLARVANGVTIPSGRKVLPGKNITSQEQVASKTTEVTAADRVFMLGVIEINVGFARGYKQLETENPENVKGINFDSGPTATDPFRDLPSFNHVETREPNYARDFGGKARIVGDVDFAQDLSSFSAVSGVKNSLRADEGEEWEVGTVKTMKDNVTFHALEESRLELGNDGTYGVRSIVHGGPTDFGAIAPLDTTITGNNVEMKDQAVFFRSRIGDNSTVGFKSLVQQSDLPAGTTVPDKTIVLNNAKFGDVEW